METVFDRVLRAVRERVRPSARSATELWLGFEQGHPYASLGEDCGRRTAGDAATDHDSTNFYRHLARSGRIDRDDNLRHCADQSMRQLASGPQSSHSREHVRLAVTRVVSESP